MAMMRLLAHINDIMILIVLFILFRKISTNNSSINSQMISNGKLGVQSISLVAFKDGEMMLFKRMKY